MWTFLQRLLGRDREPEAYLSPEALLQALAEPEERLEALEHLREVPVRWRLDSDLLEATTDLAGHGDPEVREEVVELLSDTLDELEQIREQLLSRLAARLADPSRDVRDEAAAALEQLEERDLCRLRASVEEDELAALVRRGAVSEALLEVLARMEATDLLAALGGSDPQLRCLGALLEGYHGLARLPAEPWACPVALELAHTSPPFDEEELPETAWACYASHLLAALGDPERREEASAALAALAEHPELGPLMVADDRALEALVQLELAEHPELEELLARHRHAGWVRLIWRGIEAQLDDVGPQRRAALPPGAAPEDLARLEVCLERPLDPGLRASLERHDGLGAIHGCDGDFSVAEILACYAQQLEDARPLSGVDPREHDASVPEVSWDRAWVPIWARGDGDLQCLDLASGRVLYAGHEGPAFRAVRAESFGAWLHQFRDDLRAGSEDLPVWPRYAP